MCFTKLLHSLQRDTTELLGSSSLGFCPREQALRDIIQFCFEPLQNTKKYIHSNVFNNTRWRMAFVLCSNCFCGLIKMVTRKEEHHFEDSPLCKTQPPITLQVTVLTLELCPYTTLRGNQGYRLKTNCLELRTEFPHNFPHSSSNTINIPPFKSWGKQR